MSLDGGEENVSVVLVMYFYVLVMYFYVSVVLVMYFYVRF
jgi:hypothetical protein